MPRLLLLLTVLVALPAVAQPRGQGASEPVAEAQALVAAERAGDAAALLERIVARDSRHAPAHHLLATIYAGQGPLQDLARAGRHAAQAVQVEPQNVRYLETRLAVLQRLLSEERAFSLTDGRRNSLARRILALDSTSAIANEERALAAFLEFDWRRGIADKTRGWDPEAEQGMSGAANRALDRAYAYLEHALRTEPRRASAHRLRLRAAVAAGDDTRLLRAARQYHAARPEDADAALFLGLARYRTGDLAGAEAAFEEALARMPDEHRRAFLDLTLLLDRDGREAFAADSAAVIEAFWQTRDPRLLTPQNERWLEHGARLALADLLFRDPRTDRRGWEGTRGEVAVRYGLPLRQTTALSERNGRLISWDYGDFSLLFEDTFVTGEADLWSSTEGEDMHTFARSLFARIPERFDYRPPERVGFPYLAYAFKGERGTTDLYVRYGVPVEPRGTRLRLESGVFLLNEAAEPVAEARRRIDAPASGTLRRFSEVQLWTDGFILDAAPGTYQLAVEFEQPGSGTLGFRRDALIVPDFAAAGFALSNLVLAYGAEEVEGETPAGALVRRGFAVDPAPWGVFARSQPIYLYFEAYGLTPAAEGRTRYAVEVALTPRDTSTGLARLARRFFGDRDPGVAVAFEAEGRTPDFGDYVILDAAEQEPGLYMLRLTVTDRVSGATLVRTAEVQLE